MGLLSHFLPGLRDLRAPLSAGLAWIGLLIWFFSDRVLEPARLPTPQLQRIHDWLLTWPATAQLGLLAFLAYLLGMLSVSLTETGRAWIRKASRFRVSNRARQLAAAVALELSDRFTTDRVFREAVARRLTPSIMSDVLWELYAPDFGAPGGGAVVGGQLWRFPVDVVELPTATPEERDRLAGYFLATSISNLRFRDTVLDNTVKQGTYVDKLAEELESYPEQLLVAAPAVFDRWDRTRAEAEFRQALILPSLGASLVVVWPQLSGTSLFDRPLYVALVAGLAFLVPGLLLWMSVQKGREAEVQLLAAWRARVVPSPVIESLRGDHLVWHAGVAGPVLDLDRGAVQQGSAVAAREDVT
jgi:hypothetical protein